MHCCLLQREILLQGVKHDTFLALLEYLYTGKINCSSIVSVDLLKCEWTLSK